MKKFVFVALAAVFMVSSGFSNTLAIATYTSSTEFDGGMCRYSITRISIDAEGREVQETKHYSFWAEDSGECQDRANLHVQSLYSGLKKW